MWILKGLIEQYKCKKMIKKAEKLLIKCTDIYNRNEKSIKELDTLIKEDKKSQNSSCKLMTNKEKIQSMSTEELAFLLSYFSTCDHCIYIETECARKPNYEIHCEDGIAAWLEQEVKA